MYNVYRNIYAWDNGHGGFDDRGSDISQIEQCYNIYDNLQCWDNGGHGIDIAHQKGGILSNSFSRGNGARGIRLLNTEGFDVHDCSATLNGSEGFKISLSSGNTNLTNVIVKNNRYGISLDGCNNIIFTSCQSYDDRDTPLQDYGLKLYDINTGISLLNCKLSPNKNGEIYNPNGVAINVITEKMLAKF